MEFLFLEVVIVVIGILLDIATVVLALTVRSKIVKYIPAFVGLLAAIALCIYITYNNAYYYNTDGIAEIYRLIFIFAAPEVLLSLVIAVIFDIVRHFKKRNGSSNTLKA